MKQIASSLTIKSRPLGWMLRLNPLKIRRPVAPSARAGTQPSSGEPDFLQRLREAGL